MNGQDSSQHTKVRILFLSDTHLGLDWPIRPRIKRRRRGREFFDNFDKALACAHAGEVDLVIHGGDVFFRSKVHRHVVEMAVERVLEVTKKGIPFVIVPGNHERAAMPFPLLWHHENLYVFDRPRTFVFSLRGIQLGISGFPYSYDNLTRHFGRLLKETKGLNQRADIRLLACHHIVEGAQVGPGNYTFRRGKDVLPGVQIPSEFSAVLAGHIHRHQILTADLQGRSLRTPVLYPGSTERTSFAEKDEKKGYLVLELKPTESKDGRLVKSRFVGLPSRPMIDVVHELKKLSPIQLGQRILQELGTLDPNAIVRLKLVGDETQWKSCGITEARLRRLAPETMNVRLVWQPGKR